MSSSRPWLLAIGNATELDAARAALPRSATALAATLEAAFELLDADSELWPLLVVVAEARPGELHAAAIARLRHRLPLARLVCLQGPWCEGQPRRALVSQGEWQCYWHQVSARLGRELARLDATHVPLWSLPVTATREEQMVAACPIRQNHRAETIAVCSASAQAAAALAALCRQAGYATIETASTANFRVRGASAWLWDAHCDEIVDPARVQDVMRRADAARVIALVGFPRSQDVRRAKAAGIAAVLAKPLLAADLLWHLNAVQAHAAPARSAQCSRLTP